MTNVVSGAFGAKATKMLSAGGAGNSNEPPHNEGMESRIAKLEATVSSLPTKADFAELRAEFSTLNADVKIGLSDLRGDMYKNSIDLHRWMLGTVVGLFLGFGGLFLAMSNALKQPPMTPQAQQQPVIVNVPQAPATTVK